MSMEDFREQRRQDRVVAAEQRRQDQDAAAARRRVDAEHTEQRRAGRSRARRERVHAWWEWLVARPVELMLSLIVIVPGVLAVPAMADYGVQVYGAGIGWLLPAFSEAGMWAFAFATHAARREQRPTGRLQLGVWVFAAVSAVLNFAHGLTSESGGLTRGLVMAVVAVGGVIAHQIITAAPTRRTRTARIAARRVTAMQRAATRRAVGELAADGSVQLVHQPGPVTLARNRFGLLRRLVPATAPGRAVGPVDELDEELRALISEQGSEPAGTAKTLPNPEQAGTRQLDAATAELLTEIRRAVAAGELPSPPSRRKVQNHLGVRAMTAQTVLRALRHGEDGGTAEGVAA